MLSEVDFSLLIGALLCVTVCLAFRNWRAIMWVIAVSASYALSTIYWRLNLPHAEAVTALGDGAVVLLVYHSGRYQWEMALWRLYQLSVLISILYLASNIGVLDRLSMFLLNAHIGKLPHNAYASMLEAINWLALAGLAGTAWLQRVGMSHGNSNPHWAWRLLRRANAALQRERKTPAFHRAAG